jgi:hypothetical protein
LFDVSTVRRGDQGDDKVILQHVVLVFDLYLDYMSIFFGGEVNSKTLQKGIK